MRPTARRITLLWCVELFFQITNASKTEHVHNLESWSMVYGVAARTLQYTNNSSSADQCYGELRDTAVGFANSTRWAIKMHDASGMPDGGLYWGNVFWLGSREQCLIYHSDMKMGILPSMKPKYTDSTPPFPLAYFILYARHNSSILTRVEWDHEETVQIGLCLPASCTSSDLTPLLKDYLSTAPMGLQSVYQMKLEFMALKNTEQTFSYQNATIYIIFKLTTLGILFLAILGTSYSVYCSKNIDNCGEKHKPGHDLNGNVVNPKDIVVNKPNLVHDTMMSFDIKRNFNKIFDTNPKADTLRSLDGWRVTTIVLTILNHTILYTLSNMSNRLTIFYLDSSYMKQLTYNNAFGVDSFYIVSGFLLAHNFLKKNNVHDKTTRWKTKAIMAKFSSGILKRYLRLTPQYLYTILFAGAMFAYLAPTSSILTYEDFQSHCSENWWANLLYINNLYPSFSTSCLSWTYYLANDMQYYLLGSILLYLGLFNLKISFAVGIAVLLISWFKVLYTVITRNFIPYLHIIFTTVDDFYSPPWIRICSYLSGLLLAYFVKYHKDVLDGRTFLKVVMWLVYVAGIYFSIFGILDRNVSLWYSAFYTATCRHAWAISSCIFFFCLFTNNMDEKLIAFLSYDIWIPLSKMCYGAYLLNPVVIYIAMLTSDKAVFMQGFQILLTGFGAVAVTFFLSFLMVLFIETPINNLVDVYSSIKSPKPITTTPQHNKNK